MKTNYQRHWQELRECICEPDAVFYFRLGGLNALREEICHELRREDWDKLILDIPHVKRLINRRKALCQNRI